MKNKELLILLGGWLIIIVGLYFAFELFFFSFELNGSSYTKNLLVSLGIAGAIAFFSLFPLMGIPGAILLSISSLLGFSPDNLSGDKAWPAAILASLIWPFFLPVAVVVKYYVLQSPYKEYANSSVVATTIVGIFFSVIVVNLSGHRK